MFKKSKQNQEVMMRNLRPWLATTPEARQMTSKLKTMIVDSSSEKTCELLQLETLPVCRGTEEDIDDVPLLLVV